MSFAAAKAVQCPGGQTTKSLFLRCATGSGYGSIADFVGAGSYGIFFYLVDF